MKLVAIFSKRTNNFLKRLNQEFATSTTKRRGR